MGLPYKLTSASLTLLAVCSCSGFDEDGSAVGGSRFVIEAVQSDYSALTRTQVGNIGGDGSLLMQWSPNDSIGVFGSSTANALFTGINSAAAYETSFAGQLTQGDVPLYAYYPYTAGATSAGAVPVSIPAVQKYVDESSICRYDVKAASSLTVESDGTCRMAMRQMLALVRFEISLTGVDGMSTDEKLRSISIETGSPVAGGYTFNLADLDAGLTPAAGGEVSTSVQINFPDEPSLDGTVVAYACLAPGAHAGTDWRCVMTTDSNTVTFTAKALCDLEAGTYYVMPLNAEVFENNYAVITPSDDGNGDAGNDDGEETANCYIVTETGEHSFKATVIGNGEDGIIKGAGFHTEDPYINPQSAKVVWSSKKDFITNVRLIDGRVHYTIPEDIAFTDGTISGNAVIAVYSEPDCQGEILWSWHIWGTRSMPQDVEYTNQAGARFMVMDRELGVSQLGRSDAVLYQWGRKDPFLGGEYRTLYVDGTTSSSIASRYTYRLSNDAASVLDGVQNPMYLIGGSAATTWNWLAEPNLYLWGDGGRELPAYLTDALCGAGWNQKKTIYDPSPVGYRVANIFTFSGFTDMPSGTTQDVEDDGSGINIALQRLDFINFVEDESDENSDEWAFMSHSADAQGCIYPAVNPLDGYDGREESNVAGGRWWAAEAYVNADDGRPYACWLATDDYKTSAPVSSSRTGNAVDTYARTGMLRLACAVRCVRE